MTYKSYIFKEQHNGKDIDEIMEQQVGNFKNATNNDILVILDSPHPDFPNMRVAVLNKLESDYWHNGNITASIQEKMFTVQYSYSWVS